MVYVEVEDDPVRLPGCAPLGCAPLYRMPQRKWTPKLFWQMAVYITWIVGSMTVGAMVPYIIDGAAQQTIDAAWRSRIASLPPSNYTFCPKKPVYNYKPLARGYPPPPLVTNGSDLVETWTWKKVVLKGVSWFGFNTANGMVDGLWVGGSRADTDFHALAYQIKLLGFNAVRLPFTFDGLGSPGRDQNMECKANTKSVWAERATDPLLRVGPEYAAAPDPPLYIEVEEWERDLCNTYVPSNRTALTGQRLLWTIQYFVASGFYVVLDYHPSQNDTLPGDPEAFALAWINTWAAVTCLPNFPLDLKGRVLLDLLNEPDKALAGRGVHWSRAGDTPGLDELYLTAMDAIETLTPGDALFMVQGSGAAGAEMAPGGERPYNGFNLTPGDGFVTEAALVSGHNLSDPRQFFEELLARPYATRTILAPHLYPPSISDAKLRGAVPPGGLQLFEKLASSWGKLARVGYCVGSLCQKFPVVIGEMGSELATEEDRQYYLDAAQFAAASGELSQQTAPVAGWFWWSFNANSAVTGGIVDENGTSYSWNKLRFLHSALGLRPWYTDPQAFVADQEAAQAEAGRLREAVEDAAAAAAQRKAQKEALEAEEEQEGRDAEDAARITASNLEDVVVAYKPKAQAAAEETLSVKKAPAGAATPPASASSSKSKAKAKAAAPAPAAVPKAPVYIEPEPPVLADNVLVTTMRGLFNRATGWSSAAGSAGAPATQAPGAAPAVASGAGAAAAAAAEPPAATTGGVAAEPSAEMKAPVAVAPVTGAVPVMAPQAAAPVPAAAQLIAAMTGTVAAPANQASATPAAAPSMALSETTTPSSGSGTAVDDPPPSIHLTAGKPQPQATASVQAESPGEQAASSSAAAAQAPGTEALAPVASVVSDTQAAMQALTAALIAQPAAAAAPAPAPAAAAAAAAPAANTPQDDGTEARTSSEPIV